MSVVPTSSQSFYPPTRSDNTSLTFFDKFTQDAKRNSEIRRKGLQEGQEDRSTTFDDGKQSASDPEPQTSLLTLRQYQYNDETSLQSRMSDSSSHPQSPSPLSLDTLTPPIFLANSSNETSTRRDPTFSRSTSSTFSMRWMSSLLKTSSSSGYHHQQQGGHGATPALASIFGVSADASPSSSLNPPSKRHHSSINRFSNL
ncbi:hypothetical protein BYT27DRAFT_7249351 [Phlegmacium glaucopus]|nr:hypothetical protein BYT27DRAFT_7249351 [Phlegmacium glaucopus]